MGGGWGEGKTLDEPLSAARCPQPAASPRHTLAMLHTRRERAVAWVFVALQVALITGVAIIPGGDDWPLPSVAHTAAWVVVGIAAVLGAWGARWLGAGLTVLPLPNGRVDLITHGPYRWVRHPIYAAVMLGVGAVAWMTRSLAAATLTIALVVLFAVKARFEERHLSKAFAGYEEYMRRTGRFVPRVGLPSAGSRQ